MSGQRATSSVYNIVMFSFADTDTAGTVVEALKAEQKPSGYTIVAEAVVVRDSGGKVHIHEPGRGGLGAGIGAVAGGLAGLFAGPLAVLALAVTGGAIGGVAGHFAGRALPADDLKQLGDALPPGSSAFIVMIEDTAAERLIADLSGFRANVVTLTVGDELSGVITSAVAAEAETITSGTSPASPAKPDSQAQQSPAGAPAAPPAKPDTH